MKRITPSLTLPETGHGGASGRFQVYKEIAQEHAFLLDMPEKMTEGCAGTPAEVRAKPFGLRSSHIALRMDLTRRL